MWQPLVEFAERPVEVRRLDVLRAKSLDSTQDARRALVARSLTRKARLKLAIRAANPLELDRQDERMASIVSYSALFSSSDHIRPVRTFSTRSPFVSFHSDSILTARATLELGLVLRSFCYFLIYCFRTLQSVPSSSPATTSKAFAEFVIFFMARFFSFVFYRRRISFDGYLRASCLLNNVLSFGWPLACAAF